MRKIFLSFGIGLFFLLMAPGADALTVSPVTREYHVNPGDTVIDVIQITNEATDGKTIYPQVENFTAKAETGAADFYPADEDPYGTALATWVEVVGEDRALDMQPGDRANIPFTINIPEDATPGGHFGAIILSSVPPGVELEGSGLSTKSQIAVTIFIRVSGQVKESGGLAEFGFVDPQVWYNYLPVDFFVRFENFGNVHLRPVGNLFIKNWLGRQVASIEANEGYKAILPMSIRRFVFGWQKKDLPENASELEKEWHNFGIGKYEATLVLAYGSDNKLVTDVRTFYVWPWRLIIIFAGGLLFLIAVFILLGQIQRRNLERKLEKKIAKKRGLPSEQEMREKMEKELRKKLEKEMRGKIEREMKEGAEVSENKPAAEGKPETELPDELKEE